MDAQLISLLTKNCAESAARSAKRICELARRHEVQISTLLQQFKKLLPCYRFDAVSDWESAERAITEVYFVLETREVANNYYKSESTQQIT